MRTTFLLTVPRDVHNNPPKTSCLGVWFFTVNNAPIYLNARTEGRRKKREKNNSIHRSSFDSTRFDVERRPAFCTSRFEGERQSYFSLFSRARLTVLLAPPPFQPLRSRLSQMSPNHPSTTHSTTTFHALSTFVPTRYLLRHSTHLPTGLPLLAPCQTRPILVSPFSRTVCA